MRKTAAVIMGFVELASLLAFILLFSWALPSAEEMDS